MGAKSTIPESINTEEIINNTGLSKKQISSLWTRFNELDRDAQGEAKGYKGYIDADDLGRVPKFDDNPIAPRLVEVILTDFGSNGKLLFPQFVYFMNTFGQSVRGGHHHHQSKHHLPVPTVTSPVRSSAKTDLENARYSYDDTPKTRKIKFMFRMYDIDRDGRLSKEDVQETLKMMVGKISDEEASIIAEKVIGEFTEEQANSTVSLESFERTLQTLAFTDKMGLKLLK